MLVPMIASAIAGALAKIADDYADKGLKLSPFLAILISILYGAILGYLCATTALASLFLALAFANVLAQKINKVHIFGLLSFAAAIIYLGVGEFNPYIFSLFLVSGVFDELELKRPKILAQFFQNRLATPLAALIILLHFSQPIYIIAIISFDAFYRLSEFLISKYNGK